MPQYQTGTAGNDTLTGTWWFDIIDGAEGNDTIFGDRELDHLYGGAGDDVLWGGLGGDQLFGGDGFDTAVYQTSTTGVTVNLAKIIQYGGEAEGDRLYAIEAVVGSDFDDTLSGRNPGLLFRGGGGADHISAFGGLSRASYAFSPEGVDVDITRAGAQIGGDAQGDVLLGIDNLTGSDFDDRLTGNVNRNTFSGGRGADYFDGGGNRDFVDYRGSTAVDIDLYRATQQGGHAEGDQLVSIENIRGSTADDQIVATYIDNELIGDAGNDYLDGGGGNDLLKGMTGDDTILTHSRCFADGGAGFDTLIIQFDERDPFDGVSLYVDNLGNISSRYLSDYDPPAGYNLGATGFERIEVTGTQWSDGLMGTSDADILRGAAGDDYIQGGKGDSLDGGDGRDAVELRYDPNTTADINVDLGASIATGIAMLANFEDLTVTTGRGNDHIVGGSEGNWINTQGGDDVVQLFGHHNYADLNPGDFDDFDTYIGSDGVDQVAVGNRGSVDGGGGAEDVLTLRFYGSDAVTFTAAGNFSSTGLTFVNFETFNIYRENTVAGDTLQLGEGHDLVYGGGGDDLIDGHGGYDLLRGGLGNDSLAGGTGEDQLYGDLGHDNLRGDAGADRFYFSQGLDVVTDFSVADGDMIIIGTDFQDEDHDSFADLMAHSQETAGGLLLTSSDSASTLLLAGITKADLTDAAFDLLV